MATKKAQAADGKVKARVLVNGAYGKVNDVVEVDAAEAKDNSDLDTHPDAVAYAQSLND